MTNVKGHYRTIKGKKVYVKPHKRKEGKRKRIYIKKQQFKKVGTIQNKNIYQKK